jgi:mannose-6-phosphate isomerase-like protein (cupin superfamily)
MKRLSYVAVGVVLGAFAVSAGGRVTTQDAVTLSPQYYVVRFENDRVRVLEFHMKPGEKEALHSHPAGVVYLLADATIRNGLPDGTSSEKSLKAGDVLWRENTTHTGENVGSTEARAIAIELKPCTR